MKLDQGSNCHSSEGLPTQARAALPGLVLLWLRPSPAACVRELLQVLVAVVLLGQSPLRGRASGLTMLGRTDADRRESQRHRTPWLTLRVRPAQEGRLHWRRIVQDILLGRSKDYVLPPPVPEKPLPTRSSRFQPLLLRKRPGGQLPAPASSRYP